MELQGVRLTLHKGVFFPDPSHTNSTSILLNAIPSMIGKSVLDMGCGTGVLGIYAAIHGAKKVVLTDVKEEALSNTRENIELNEVTSVCEVITSNLFENVSGTFDYILGNLPIVDGSWDLDVTTVDLLKKFLTDSKEYLNSDGVVYFTWNSESDVLALRSFLKDNHFVYDEYEEEGSERIWYLFKVQF